MRLSRTIDGKVFLDASTPGVRKGGKATLKARLFVPVASLRERWRGDMEREGGGVASSVRRTPSA